MQTPRLPNAVAIGLTFVVAAGVYLVIRIVLFDL
jgi:hypothetical protein